jgi:hypothetical protein
MLDPSFQGFIISRFHNLLHLMNNMENGKGVVARLTGLTQYSKITFCSIERHRLNWSHSVIYLVGTTGSVVG